MRRQESEKALEARLVKEIQERGGMCLKYTSQYHRGIPDRIVLMPGGCCYFAEMKSTGKKPTPLQERAIGQLREMAHLVAVIDSTEKLEDFLHTIDLEQDMIAG